MSKLGSNNLIENLGIMLVLVVTLVVFLVVLVILKFVFGRFEYMQRMYKKIMDKIFWNLFIRYIMQSQLKIMIGSYLTVGLVSWASYQGII